MNLHDLSHDIVIEYMQDRYPDYQFHRLGEETVQFRYRTEQQWTIITNYTDYLRLANQWAAMRYNS